MSEPDSEDEWELVEDSNTRAVANEDAGVDHEWELAYPPTSLPNGRDNARDPPQCCLTLTVTRLELLGRQRGPMHHRVGLPAAFQVSLWDVRLPERGEDQEDKWSVATTCGEEPEDQTMLCELCRILFPNYRKFDEHLRSVKHLRRLREYRKHRPEAGQLDPFNQGVLLQLTSACPRDLCQ